MAPAFFRGVALIPRGVDDRTPFSSPFLVSSFWESHSSSTRSFLFSFSFRPFFHCAFLAKVVALLVAQASSEVSGNAKLVSLLCFAVGSPTSMTRILSVGAAALAASSVIGTASAASLYAFYTGTDAGVQIGMQDPKSGDIWVNDCSKMNNGNPLFPTDTPLVLPILTPVKMGGSIAATGWWDSQKVIVSITKLACISPGCWRRGLKKREKKDKRLVYQMPGTDLLMSGAFLDIRLLALSKRHHCQRHLQLRQRVRHIRPPGPRICHLRDGKHQELVHPREHGPGR